MRGRLRVVSDDNLKTVTWTEVPDLYWLATFEDDVEVPTIEVPALPDGSESPDYGIGISLENDVEVPTIEVPALPDGSKLPDYGVGISN